VKRFGVTSDVRQVDWRQGTQQGAETVSHDKDYVDCNVSRSFPQQLSQTEASLHDQKAQRVFHLKRDRRRGGWRFRPGGDGRTEAVGGRIE
jgi:hypothetical protein